MLINITMIPWVKNIALNLFKKNMSRVCKLAEHIRTWWRHFQKVRSSIDFYVSISVIVNQLAIKQ